MNGMLKIDDNLLQSVGLGTLPINVKNQLLAQIYTMLEERVGEKLANMMSPDQLDEFEKFVDTQTDFSTAWLTHHVPDYQEAEDYKKHMAGVTGPDGVQVPGMLQEFAALKWLELHFPSHKDVVAEELEKLKGELRRDAEMIIASVAGQAAPAQPVQPPAQG
jgi:Protein of unknown function (DUF5663)